MPKEHAASAGTVSSAKIVLPAYQAEKSAVIGNAVVAVTASTPNRMRITIKSPDCGNKDTKTQKNTQMICLPRPGTGRAKEN